MASFQWKRQHDDLKRRGVGQREEPSSKKVPMHTSHNLNMQPLAHTGYYVSAAEVDRLQTPSAHTN